MNTYPIFRTKHNLRANTSIVGEDKYHSLYMVCANQVTEFREAIASAKDTFSQEQIWPDQCDYVIYKMNPLKKTANTIAESVKRQRRKPSGYNHYPLLVSACHFTDQVDILIDCVREYREVTDQRSARKLKQKLIITSLRNLESSLHDLMKELDKTMVNSKLL